MDAHDRIAPPRIDPATTPIWEIGADRRLATVGGPNSESPEADLTKAVIREQGFDGPPHVVSWREMDAYVAAGDVELFRGLADARFAEQLRVGDFFVGRGGEVGGMYTAAGPHALVIARQYAAGGDGTVVRLALKRGARVIAWDDLEQREAVDLSRLGNVPPAVARVLYNDLGGLAAYLGYDAVHIVDFPDIDYYVVLNRTALRVQKENLR